MILMAVCIALTFLLGVIVGIGLIVWFDWHSTFWNQIPDDQKEEFDYYGMEMRDETSTLDPLADH